MLYFIAGSSFAGFVSELMAGRGGVAKLVGTLRMYIPAGQASPSPPLGPALGQVINFT